MEPPCLMGIASILSNISICMYFCDLVARLLPYDYCCVKLISYSEIVSV